MGALWIHHFVVLHTLQLRFHIAAEALQQLHRLTDTIRLAEVWLAVPALLKMERSGLEHRHRYQPAGDYGH
jgi:hypothetical protein